MSFHEKAVKKIDFGYHPVHRGAMANAAGVQAADNNDLAEYTGEEYVVTATRTQLTKEENPRSVEVITKEDIENTGAISVRDALRTASNLDISSSGGSTGDTIYIRGNDDVLIMVNGRRMASEGQFSFINQNGFTLDRLNINSVERIEILRGPDAAIYGSGAQGGIINIITKKSDKQSATVGVTTGTREMSNYYHLDSGKQGKVSAVFDANFSKMRNVDSKLGGDNHWLYGTKQNYSLDLDYDMDENNNLNLWLDYRKDNLQYYNSSSWNRWGGLAAGVQPFTSERKTAVLTYSGKSHNNDYSLSASYSTMDRDAALVDSPKSNSSKRYQSWNVEARDTITTAKDNKLVIGAEYRDDKARIYGSDESKSIGQYSVYLHDEFRAGKHLLLTPSIRYDHHDSFGGNTSPSLGATYFVNDKARIKASYGSGYRAPSIDELYGAFDHGGMFNMMGLGILGNADLKPEKTRGVELSYEQEFSKDTSAKVTYFKNKKKDAIQMSGLKFGMGYTTGYYTWINVDEASYEGVEFEMKHNFGKGFTISGNYDYLDAYDESTGDRLGYNARNTYMLKLSWTEPVKKEWNVTMWNKWYSDYVYGTNHGGTAVNYSVNTFNFVVNKRWSDKYRAFFGIDNVFNKDLVDMGFYGRVWRVGAEMTF